ncbi:hypothetical protein KCU65_g9539, partial [Aureobasidium melanogenum]
MPPTTRSSTKQATAVDTRGIVSWASAVTGETVFYERFHEYDEEGEVLFVQLRINEQGELVPWTNDEEDEDHDLEMADEDSAEEGEVDPDFVPEATRTADEDHVGVQKLAQEAQMALKQQRRAPARRRQTSKVNRTTPLPANALPGVLLPADLVVGMIDDMTDLVQHESILDFVVEPLSEAILQSTSQQSLSSMLINFRVRDLSEVNGAGAHAMEKEAYDSVRPSKFINGRRVLDPRHVIFRPSNPAYKEIVDLGPL